MPTYRSVPPRPKAGLIDDLDYGPAATAEEIILPENRARFTGLLDAQGNRIFRSPEPIGFKLR